MRNLDDAFVNISFNDEPSDAAHPDWHGHHRTDYSAFLEQGSAKYAAPELQGADALRKLHPGYSLVLTSDYRLDPTIFPGATVVPVDEDKNVLEVVFFALSLKTSPIPGRLGHVIDYAGYKVTWEDHEFIVHVVKVPSGLGSKYVRFFLHNGPEETIREFLLTLGLWSDGLRNEIWVFDNGFWRKDAKLWQEVQKADWKDVILKDEVKSTLQKDVYGFFDSEELYRKLAIPWKRGIIMYGPPGNGKTISIKAIMKTCDVKGFKPLYVRSFKSYMGEEAAMSDVFTKARQLSPCVVVLEDLDALINNQNRSFFLNQLDGLDDNDGLLVIGTTNHFDRLDPGLSSRPSRFDRKYLFDDPDAGERKLYCGYWQNKLKDNKDVEFPDSLVDEIVDKTDHFSFAYLKEAFVSTLVLLATHEGKKPPFTEIIKDTIKSLRKQLDKSNATRMPLRSPIAPQTSREERQSTERRNRLFPPFLESWMNTQGGGPPQDTLPTYMNLPPPSDPYYPGLSGTPTESEHRGHWYRLQQRQRQMLRDSLLPGGHSGAPEDWSAGFGHPF